MLSMEGVRSVFTVDYTACTINLCSPVKYHHTVDSTDNII